MSKFFSTNRSEVGLAQFGFIVVTMGEPRVGIPHGPSGTTTTDTGTCGTTASRDKKATIEQLADRFDFVDMDRVGIYGHSGGGFMSTAAMLVYPGFFDVARVVLREPQQRRLQPLVVRDAPWCEGSRRRRGRGEFRVRHQEELGPSRPTSRGI